MKIETYTKTLHTACRCSWCARQIPANTTAIVEKDVLANDMDMRYQWAYHPDCYDAMLDYIETCNHQQTDTQIQIVGDFQ